MSVIKDSKLKVRLTCLPFLQSTCDYHILHPLTFNMSTAASSPRTIDLDNTYGALFIGLLAAAVFVKPFTDVDLSD
jgi:hypothetical protein